MMFWNPSAAGNTARAEESRPDPAFHAFRAAAPGGRLLARELAEAENHAVGAVQHTRLSSPRCPGSMRWKSDSGRGALSAHSGSEQHGASFPQVPPLPVRPLVSAPAQGSLRPPATPSSSVRSPCSPLELLGDSIPDLPPTPHSDWGLAPFRLSFQALTTDFSDGISELPHPFPWAPSRHLLASSRGAGYPLWALSGLLNSRPRSRSEFIPLAHGGPWTGSFAR